MRSFCGNCGTGLFYRNAEMLPGLVEVQLATLDAADTLAPTMHIQTAERLPWSASPERAAIRRRIRRITLP